MESNRGYRAKINVLFGILNKVFNCILPFVSRTVVLYWLGSQYLGLGTLFTSILSFLSLTELGFSSAINYAMYQPLAYGDNKKVGSLLLLFKKIYRLIGIVMLAIGVLIIPLIPHLISGSVPTDINITLLYLIYLLSAVASYFFGGYRQSLLSASQREDIISKIGILILLFNNLGQVIVLWIFKNYYVFAIVPILGAVITNVSCAVISRKLYPDIEAKGQVDSDTKKIIKKKISGLFGTKLNSVVVHQADTLVISAFLGLELLAAYGNYYYIMNAVSAFVVVIFTSLTASVGNKLALDSIDSNYLLFKKISFVNSWIVGFCCCCFVCIFQPFMRIWVGETLVLPFGLVILLAIYFFVYQIQRTILTFKDAAGLWYEDRYRPYISMIFNVISNIVLVQFIGLYGIVISTIVAFLISVPWANYVLHHYLFKKRSAFNIFEILRWFLATMVATLVCYLICNIMKDGLIGIILRLVICMIIPNFVFVILFWRRDEFKYIKNIVVRKLIRRR